MNKPKRQPEWLNKFQKRFLAPSGELRSPVEFETDNVYTSVAPRGRHFPIFDIDTRIEVVPSKTAGHSHLIFTDKTLTWDAYVEVLETLAKHGLVDRRWVKVAVASGQAALRLPGSTTPGKLVHTSSGDYGEVWTHEYDAPGLRKSRLAFG